MNKKERWGGLTVISQHEEKQEAVIEALHSLCDNTKSHEAEQRYMQAIACINDAMDWEARERNGD